MFDPTKDLAHQGADPHASTSAKPRLMLVLNIGPEKHLAAKKTHLPQEVIRSESKHFMSAYMRVSRLAVFKV